MYSELDVKYLLLLNGMPLSECGLRLFFQLVPPTKRALKALKIIGSSCQNCLLNALSVSCDHEGSTIELAVNSGWIRHTSSEKAFIDEHLVARVGDLLVVGMQNVGGPQGGADGLPDQPDQQDHPQGAFSRAISLVRNRPRPVRRM